MKSFYKFLGIALLVSTTNNFVWFALTFWIYLETKSVVSTSTIAALWLVATALSGIWFGSIVDHNKKKKVMMGSSFGTLLTFIAGFFVYLRTPEAMFTSISNPILWVFAFTLLAGVVIGGIYGITGPTLVALLVPEKDHDKANGMFGTVMGISFAITSVASGLTLAYLGMYWVLVFAIVATVIAIISLTFLNIPEKNIAHLPHNGDPVSASHELQSGPSHKKVDLKGTIAVIKKVPGLFALIFFTTFNNFLGGVFMALMDAYGLTLVNVQTWGMLWGFLSFGFIVGGIYISKFGLGKNPVKTLFLINIILWIDCILFTALPSIVLLATGMLVWMAFVPFVEATEQTIFQKVVPKERLGRVFGFAHSIEQAASPMTAFFIGPIAQAFFIPFMTTGRGVELIGDWFGVGTGRGIALVFISAGILGLIVTLIAKNSKSFHHLSAITAKK
jgi:DHA3 family multidrug efflux protein-like MFS transporter